MLNVNNNRVSASLIIIKHIKSKNIDVQWSEETKLVFDDIVFNSDVSICRYLARLFPDYKLYGASTFQYTEVPFDSANLNLAAWYW